MAGDPMDERAESLLHAHGGAIGSWDDLAAILRDVRSETVRECLSVVRGAESKGDAEDALAEMLGGDRG